MGKKNPLEKKNKKRVEKLGKGKKAASNATQTSFKTAKIHVSTPNALKSKGDLTNNRNLTLTDLFAKLRHHKDASRSDALDHIRSFLTEQPQLLKSQMHAILESVLGSSSDLHTSVRSSFLKIMEFLFSQTSPSNITPFLPLIIAYVSHTITHDIPMVQTDGLRFFKLLTSFYPHLLASPEFSSQLLPKLVVLMIQRFKESKSRAGDLQDVSASSSSSSSQSKASKSGKESSISLLVEVLYLYLGLCITSARGGEKRRGGREGIIGQNSSHFELREAVGELMEVSRREALQKKEREEGDMEWEKMGEEPLKVLEGGEKRWEGGGGMKAGGAMGCCYSRSAIRVSGSTSVQKLGNAFSASSASSSVASLGGGGGGGGDRGREGTIIESLKSVSLNAIAAYESKSPVLNGWEYSWTLCLVDILFAHWVESCPNEVVMALVSGVGEAGEGKRQRNVRISYFLTMILKVLNLFVELWTLEVGKGGKKGQEAVTQAALMHLLKSTEKHIIPLFPFRVDKRGDSVIGMALFDLNLEGGWLLSSLIHLMGWVGKGGKEGKGQKKPNEKNTFANSAVSPSPPPTPKANRKGVPFSWVTKMGVFIHNIFQNELKKAPLSIEINTDNGAVGGGTTGIRFFRTPDERCAVSLGLLVGFFVKISGEGVEEEELCTLREKVLAGFSTYFKERQLISVAKGMSLCVVEWVFHNYAVVWEGEAEGKVLVDWLLYLPKLLYQLGQGMSRPSSSPSSYTPLLERLIRLLHYLCSRQPAPSSSSTDQSSPSPAVPSLFSLSQTHISTLQTTLVPFLFVMSPKHGGGLLGPFLDLTPELQTSFLSLLYYLPSFDGNMLKALAAVCGLSDNTQLRYGNIVFVVDLLLSRASGEKNGLASFFSFLTTVIVERSNPEESSLPLPQKAKKRKRDALSSPPSPYVDKSLITLFSNSLCSLSSIPHSQTLLLLEGSASLILQSTKHPKSKSAMIALLGAFLHRVAPPSSLKRGEGEEEEGKLALSEGFLKTLVGGMKASLMYLHSLSSAQAGGGEGGERGWEGNSGEGQWGWETCVRVFCFNKELLPVFLRLVEKEAKELMKGGGSQQNKKPKTPSSSSSVLELDELVSCVTHIVNTSLLHSRLRDCTEDCEKFTKEMTKICDSSSLSSLILSLRVALGKDSLGEDS